MSILPQECGVRKIDQNWKIEVLPKKFIESTLLFEYTPALLSVILRPLPRPSRQPLDKVQFRLGLSGA